MAASNSSLLAHRTDSSVLPRPRLNGVDFCRDGTRHRAQALFALMIALVGVAAQLQKGFPVASVATP